MPHQTTVVLVHDPAWFWKLLLVALLLTVPLTIGAYLVKAGRKTIPLTFFICLGALLVGHLVTLVISGGWQALAVVAAVVLITLGLGIRYILVTSMLASVSIALAMMVILFAGIGLFGN